MRALVYTTLLLLAPSLAVAQTMVAKPMSGTLLQTAPPPGGPPPTGLRAGATPTTITLKWTCPTGATGYEVFATQAGSFQQLKLTQTPISPQCIQDVQLQTTRTLDSRFAQTTQTAYVSSFTHNGLAPGMQFNYMVRALYSQGVGDSEGLLAQTAPWPAPTAVTPTLTGRSVRLSWNPVPGAAAYVVLRQLAGEGGLTSITPTPISATSYSDATILAPGEHRYSVHAVSGTPAAAVSVQLGNWPAPTFTSVDLNGRRITMHWRQMAGVTGYAVYRKSLLEASFRQVATLPASQYYYIEENLPVGPHTFYVQATGPADASAPISVISGKPHRGGARVFRGQPVITLGWDGTDLASAVKIFRSPALNAAYYEITQQVHFYEMTAQYREARVGATEYYKVIAFYPTGAMESDAIPVTIPLPPVGPTNLVAVSPAKTDAYVSPGQVTVLITWTCDPEATSYGVMKGPKSRGLAWYANRVNGCAFLDIFWPNNIYEYDYDIIGVYPDPSTVKDALISVTARKP